MAEISRDISNLKYYEVTQKNPIIMKLETSKRKRLYHYTTKAGAKGILGNNSLWVTHSRFLDDTSEIKYICCVIDGLIMYLKENKELYDLGADGQFYIYEGIIKTLESLREVYEDGPPIIEGNIFLLSLTENKNNKYLFENYCGRDGAVLEFRNNIPDMFIAKNNLMCTFSAKVIYDYEKQMEIILEDFNEFYTELVSNLVSEKIFDCIEMAETIKTVITIKIINYSFFFKHYKYSKEEEYRVVFLVAGDYNNKLVNYRNKSGKQVPYIEVNFKMKSLIHTRFI